MTTYILIIYFFAIRLNILVLVVLISSRPSLRSSSGPRLDNFFAISNRTLYSIHGYVVPFSLRNISYQLLLTSLIHLSIGYSVTKPKYMIFQQGLNTKLLVCLIGFKRRLNLLSGLKRADRNNKPYNKR